MLNLFEKYMNEEQYNTGSTAIYDEQIVIIIFLRKTLEDTRKIA